MSEQTVHRHEDILTPATEASIYTFIKEEKNWQIHIPGYTEQGGNKKDLELPEGTGKLLNMIAQGRKKLTLKLSKEPFQGADELELIEHCGAPKGGAFYLMHTCQGKESGDLIWVCDIALFVFGDMPDHIYVQCLKVR